MSFRKLQYFVPLVALAGFLAPWGCSATTDDGNSNPTPSTSSTTVGTGTGGSGGSEPGTGGEGGLNIGVGGGGQGGSNVDPDAACTSTSAEAELIPLDMIVLLDKSGSMSGSLWNGSVAALSNFFDAPEADGINVGLQYYPINSSCDYTIYNNLAVDIAALPLNAPVLKASLAGETPNGPNTPTWGALRGVLTKATAHQDANPDHKVIVVLATDGSPNGCTGNDTTTAIAQLATQARLYNGVQTYLIAMQGANVANLNQIAMAGGTTQAYDVTGNINLFAQKMAEIRANALACEFPIPDPPLGEMLDLYKVAVSFTGSNGVTTELPRVNNATLCGNGPGWYFDKPIDSTPPPTQIALCPNSCETARSNSSVQLKVLFGCAPRVD
ncbi:vWA domain-containing protein [Chondromyces crocatus]|uniref:VWFA domain-containing protein n=1 Tax=Chondromyces crocatus TaxID=52 RepID=A0A0K1EA36_CHOCO|nr:vWA domain-containing protein [Chondromyces crocatus]AKT37709.1 uncharacterized protein CMC5_018510 [Chondromyces crocatus]